MTVAVLEAGLFFISAFVAQDYDMKDLAPASDLYASASHLIDINNPSKSQPVDKRTSGHPVRRAFLSYLKLPLQYRLFSYLTKMEGRCCHGAANMT